MSIHDSTYNDNVLALWNDGNPCLGENDTIDPGNDRERFFVNVTKVMKETDGLPLFDVRSAIDQWFIMPGKRCDGKTVPIHHLQFSLGAIAVIVNGINLSFELPMMNRGCQHSLSCITHASSADGSSPA